MMKSIVEDFVAAKLGLERIEKERAAERARPAPEEKAEEGADDKFDWSSVLAQGLSDVYGC